MPIVTKLALQAGLCYNGVLNTVVSGDAANTPDRINLYRRFIMDTLSSPAQNGNPSPEKRCSGPCGRLLPATPEYFYRDKRRKDGCVNPCKACINARNSQPETREQKLSYLKAYRQTEQGYERSKASADKPENREKKRIRDRERRSRPEVREKNAAYEKAHNSRPEIQEQEAASRKAYYSRPEIQERGRIYRQEHREQEQAYRQEYRKRPGVLERLHVSRSNRRAQIRHSVGTHTPEQLREQYDRQKGKCYYCRVKVVWGKHHFDHVIPLSRGGSNDISNIVATCAHCNLSKNKKLPHEFSRGGRLL